MAATDLVNEAAIDALVTQIGTSDKARDTALAARLAEIGTIGDLDTTATDLVEAVNEVKVTADAAAGGGVAINDGATNGVNAWSSQKITDEITAAITAVIDGAPGALDTLDELAAAIGDNASYAASITTALAARLRFDAAQALTAPEKAQALTNLGIVASTVDFAAAYVAAIA